MVEIPKKSLLRQDEVTQILDCSRDHLAHLREDGSLEFVNTGCKFAVRPNWRIKRESLLEFLESRSSLKGRVV